MGESSINQLELWPIVVAARRWGPCWFNQKIRVFTDNTQVMTAINTGRSSSIQTMSILRELFWLSFIFNFHIVASYIRTSDNLVPDFLSRYFDTKRCASIPPHLLWDLCCFRDGLIVDQVEGAPRQLVS